MAADAEEGLFTTKEVEVIYGKPIIPKVVWITVKGRLFQRIGSSNQWREYGPD